MKFETLNPNDVRVGRGLAARALRAPFVQALQDGDAGKITLDEGENQATVKRHLHNAARQLGVRVRASHVPDETAIYWKKVSA